MPIKLNKKQIIILACLLAAVISVIISIIIIIVAFDLSGGTPERLDCVEAHNKYRSMHDCPPLEVDEKIVKFAMEWAKKIAKIRYIAQRHRNIYGENVYAASKKEELTCEEVVKAWYGEIKDFNYDDPKYTLRTEHFSQVIWKESKKLGCVQAKNEIFNFVICNYYPSGNIDGAFAYNVPPKKVQY